MSELARQGSSEGPALSVRQHCTEEVLAGSKELLTTLTHTHGNKQRNCASQRWPCTQPPLLVLEESLLVCRAHTEHAYHANTLGGTCTGSEGDLALPRQQQARTEG